MFNWFGLILGSSVITALITSIFTKNNEKSKRKMSGITDQRAQWRNELRDISFEIQNSKNIEELKKITNKLKVRINPFGITKSNTQNNNDKYEYDTFKNDAYIWDTIKSIDALVDSTSDIKVFKILKDELLLKLSILLKYDWERSKSEIIPDHSRIITTFLLLCLFMSFSIFYLFSYSGSITNWSIIFSFLFIFTMTFIAGKLFKKYLNFKFNWRKKGDFIKKVCKSFFYLFTISIALCLTILFYLKIGDKNQVDIYQLMNLSFCIVFLFFNIINIALFPDEIESKYVDLLNSLFKS